MKTIAIAICLVLGAVSLAGCAAGKSRKITQSQCAAKSGSWVKVAKGYACFHNGEFEDGGE